MKILAIESSCDETAAAVTEERKVLSNVVASQVAEHRKYGGVVPEIASRRHAENIIDVTDKALKDAGCTLNDIDAIAVTYAPGLIGALLVGVNPEDLEGDNVFAGCELQAKIEQKAYWVGNGAVPITTVGNFVFDKKAEIGSVKPTVKPDFVFADLREIYPSFITDSLKDGIIEMDKKIHGFACDDAILTAPETRSSSPVRIVRNEAGESTNFSGIYPCGEGAGYAGGIMSAAVDGIKSAEKIIDIVKTAHKNI